MAHWPAGKEASLGESGHCYERHRPEQTLLYQLVEEYYPAFVAQLAAQGTQLPGYVQRDFEDYLKCGRLEHGFLRVRGAWRKALPCWWMRCCPVSPCANGCSACLTRSGFCLPAALRSWARCSASSTARLPKKAGRTHKTAHTGAVTLIQRFGSALNLNIHFHMLFLDGDYIDGSNGAQFRWVKAPTSVELTALVHMMAQRIGRYLERQGLLERDSENSYLAWDAVDEDSMDQLIGHSITYRIAVGPQAGRKVFSLQTLPACDDADEPFTDTVGKVAGFSLHAGVAAKAQEQDKLERLCRYIARLAALVPKPRVNLTRFHGVFAPNSKHRVQVTPARRGKGKKSKAPDEAQDKTPGERRASMTWAQRLKRVFDIDIETCSECGGAVKVIACIEDPVVIEKILTHLKEEIPAAKPIRLPESRAPPHHQK